jgi:hypothetical protein
MAPAAQELSTKAKGKKLAPETMTANKTSILTPDPLRVEIAMTIQTSTRKSEFALGQA